MTSHVAQQVAARIAAARQKDAEDKRRRQELAEARQHGLAARHAQKLNRQANYLINERRPPMQTQTSAEQATPSDRHQPAALLITLDGAIIDLDLPEDREHFLPFARAVLRCDTVEHVDLCDGVSLWIDEDGRERQPYNPLASTLRHWFGALPDVHGAVLVTGYRDRVEPLSAGNWWRLCSELNQINPAF